MQSQPRRFLTARLATLAWIACGLTALGQAHKTGEVRIVADLIDRLPEAKAQHAADISIRPNGIVGNVEKPSIYHHPLHSPSESTLDYSLGLPELKENEQLFLTFSIGISDGVNLTGSEDGVAFSVRANGETIFHKGHAKTEWAAHAIDVSRFAGKPAALTLAVDSLRNSSYDWAVWGEPAVLKVSPTKTERNRGPVSGVILAKRPMDEPRTLMVDDQKHTITPPKKGQGLLEIRFQ
jgi:hypothetical protein